MTKSICFFSSYFEDGKIPYYVQCYLIELRRHFDELVLLFNKKILNSQEADFLKQYRIEALPVENEGFDFGMWGKALKSYPLEEYGRIGLINDSCILFGRLDAVFKAIDNSSWDYCGIIDSMQVRYHLQSYFLIVNKPAVRSVIEYFDLHGIERSIQGVINVYEIGIAEFLLNSDLKLGAVFSHTVCEDYLNPSFSGIAKLIVQKFPMIKKKIIFGNYRKAEVLHLGANGFNFNAEDYVKLIKQNNQDLIVDFEELKKDYNYDQAKFKLSLFNLLRAPLACMRKIYRATLKPLLRS
jgi:lipopolysaccharide biosynthesis protein